MFRRGFTSEKFGTRLWRDILKDNSGTILALGVIGSASFGAGLYLNQLKVFEEKLKLVEERAKKDVVLAEERAKKESLQLLYNIFTQEEYKDAKKKLLAKNKDE
jgi:hypothetical protein